MRRTLHGALAPLLLLTPLAVFAQSGPNPKAAPPASPGLPSVSTSTQAPPGAKQAEIQDIRPLTPMEQSDPYQYERLGVAMAQSGDLAKSREAFEKAWTLGELPSAPFNIACLDARQGKVEAAFAQLDRALAAGFDDEKTLRTDKDLESLRSKPRFQSVLAGAKKNAAAGDAAVVKDGTFVAPRGPATAILLLLHDASSDPLAVASPFLAQAQERGLYVAVPRGPATAGKKRFGWGSPERASTAVSAAILEARKRAGNLPVIAVGVGRGGMLAGLVAATQPGLLAGVATISGPFDPSWLRSEAAVAGMKQTRVFLGLSQGASSPVAQAFRQGRDGLKSAGIPLTYREWPGLGTAMPADAKGAVSEILTALMGK